MKKYDCFHHNDRNGSVHARSEEEALATFKALTPTASHHRVVLSGPPVMVSFVDDQGNKSAEADIAWHQQQESAMTEKWFAFKAYNTATLYAYGTAAKAEKYADVLNRKREVNLYGAYPLSEDDRLAQQLPDCPEAICLDEELAWLTGDDNV